MIITAIALVVAGLALADAARCERLRRAAAVELAFVKRERDAWVIQFESAVRKARETAVQA